MDAMVTMSRSWGRGVYVDGELSTWGHTPIAKTAHQLMHDAVLTLKMMQINDAWDITIASHSIDGGVGTMLVVRFREARALNYHMHHAYFRNEVAKFFSTLMTLRCQANNIDPMTYVGMITVAAVDSHVISDFSHSL
jgi:hypothetical protein